MSGATSRRRGHNWERQLARTLSARLDLDVATARSVSGGYQAGSDLVTRRPPGVQHHVLGWSVEAKAVGPDGRRRVSQWCRQAREQADGNSWVVCAKVPHKSVGEGEAYCRLSSLVPQVGGTEIRRLSIAAFTDLLVAFRGYE